MTKVMQNCTWFYQSRTKGQLSLIFIIISMKNVELQSLAFDHLWQSPLLAVLKAFKCSYLNTCQNCTLYNQCIAFDAYGSNLFWLGALSTKPLFAFFQSFQKIKSQQFHDFPLGFLTNGFNYLWIIWFSWYCQTQFYLHFGQYICCQRTSTKDKTGQSAYKICAIPWVLSFISSKLPGLEPLNSVPGFLIDIDCCTPKLARTKD